MSARGPASDIRDGCFRLLAVMVHRYSREPSTRRLSSRQAMEAAIMLHAKETSPGEAALVAAETLAQLAQEQRRAEVAQVLGLPGRGGRA